MGLHLRYAEIFGKELSVSSMCLSKNEEEIDTIAKSGQVSSVISMQEKMQKRLQGLC